MPNPEKLIPDGPEEILRPVVNFTIILRAAAFLYESVLRSFSLITAWFCNFFE